MKDYWLEYVQRFYEFSFDWNDWRLGRLFVRIDRAILAEDFDKAHALLNRVRFLNERLDRIHDELWAITWQRMGITEFFDWGYWR